MALDNGFTIFSDTVTADTTGSWVRMPGQIVESLLVLDATSITGTTPVFTVTVETSIDGGSVNTQTLDAFAATSGATDQQQTLRADEWNSAANQPKETAWRYVRANITTSGTTPSAAILVRMFGRAT